MLAEQRLARRQLMNFDGRRVPRIHFNRPGVAVAKYVVHAEPTEETGRPSQNFTELVQLGG